MLGLEPIIALAVGSLLGLAATHIAKYTQKRRLVKYGPILSKAYDIIDPLLERHMRGWTGSDIDFAMGIAIKAVADGNLSDREVKEIVIEASKRWLPQKAADKVRAYEKALNQSKEIWAANIISKAVTGTTDPRDVLSQVKTILGNTNG